MCERASDSLAQDSWFLGSPEQLVPPWAFANNPLTPLRSVTFATSLKFSGSMAVALKVVGSDFFTKAATMFIGERVMNKSQAGREGGGDAAGRSIGKALLWRLFAISNTIVAVVFVGKEGWAVAGKIASFDAVVKTAMMFFYERVWAKIDWGK